MSKSKIGLHVVHERLRSCYFSTVSSRPDASQFAKLYIADSGKQLPKQHSYCRIYVTGSFHPVTGRRTEHFSGLKVAARKIAEHNEAYRQITLALDEFGRDIGPNRLLVEGVPSLKDVPYTFTLPITLSITALRWCRMVRDFYVIGFEDGTDLAAMADLVKIPTI